MTAVVCTPADQNKIFENIERIWQDPNLAYDFSLDEFNRLSELGRKFDLTTVQATRYGEYSVIVHSHGLSPKA